MKTNKSIVKNILKMKKGDLEKLGDNWSIKTPTGYIMLVGGWDLGILSKLDNHEQYFFVGEKWVKV